MTKAAVLVHTLALIVVASTARADAVTWHYTGTIVPANRNDIGFPVPVGAPVSLEITFDSETPDTNALPGVASYLMSGGLAKFQMSIGTHMSNVVDAFQIVVVKHQCNCATDEQITFLSHDWRFIDIDFPGFLENAQTQLVFSNSVRPGKITSTDLPILPPDPSRFEVAGIFLGKNVYAPRTSPQLIFGASLDREYLIPEPSGLTLSIIAMPMLMFRAFRRRTAPF